MSSMRVCIHNETIIGGKSEHLNLQTLIAEIGPIGLQELAKKLKTHVSFAIVLCYFCVKFVFQLHQRPASGCIHRLCFKVPLKQPNLQLYLFGYKACQKQLKLNHPYFYTANEISLNEYLYRCFFSVKYSFLLHGYKKYIYLFFECNISILLIILLLFIFCHCRLFVQYS